MKPSACSAAKLRRLTPSERRKGRGSAAGWDVARRRTERRASPCDWTGWARHRARRPARLGCLELTELAVTLPSVRFPVDVSGRRAALSPSARGAPAPHARAVGRRARARHGAHAARPFRGTDAARLDRRAPVGRDHGRHRRALGRVIAFEVAIDAVEDDELCLVPVRGARPGPSCACGRRSRHAPWRARSDPSHGEKASLRDRERLRAHHTGADAGCRRARSRLQGRPLHRRHVRQGRVDSPRVVGRRSGASRGGREARESRHPAP